MYTHICIICISLSLSLPLYIYMTCICMLVYIGMYTPYVCIWIFRYTHACVHMYICVYIFFIYMHQDFVIVGYDPMCNCSDGFLFQIRCRILQTTPLKGPIRRQEPPDTQALPRCMGAAGPDSMPAISCRTCHAPVGLGCIYTYLYTYIITSAYTSMYIYICIQIYIDVFMYPHIHISGYIYICVYMSIHMYV